MLIDLIRGIFSGEGFDLLSAFIGVLSSLFVIFCTLPVHEYAHALVADKLGDHTAKFQGRLTLNPMRHIDYMGALMILLVGFGYAKPVPVNMYNLKKPKLDMALVALAGPLSNVIMAFISLLLRNIVLVLVYFGILQYAIASYITLFFMYVTIINVSLAAFNLIPVPPLDGSKILFSILPNRIYYTIMQYERYISFVLIILVYSRLLDGPINFISSVIINGISTIANIPFNLLGVF